MNKNLIYLIVLFTINSSCTCTKKNNSAISQINSESRKLDLEENSNSTLNTWVSYYRKLKPDFSLSNFELDSEEYSLPNKGTIYGIFDKNFDPIYTDFLIYNSNKNQYLDFDSFNWSLDESGNPSFSVDQEINLVNIKEQTISRIAYYGPSQWVEDAFWKNDSIIFLLENSPEKQLRITKINLNSNLFITFKYIDTLTFNSNYTKIRFNTKGIKAY